MNNDKLKDHFDKLVKSFITHKGAPMCFGRMEGFKDYAEITGNKELIDYIQNSLMFYNKELKELCSG